MSVKGNRNDTEIRRVLQERLRIIDNPIIRQTLRVTRLEVPAFCFFTVFHNTNTKCTAPASKAA